MKLFSIGAGLVLAGLLAVGGCQGAGKAEAPSGGKPKVVTTTAHLADAVRQVAGDAVEVTALIGPGVDPHLYKPTAGDLSRLSAADIVVVHGLDLEGRMGDVLAGLEKQGLTLIEAAEAVPKEKRILSKDSAKKADPHVWFDPMLWREAVEGLAQGLAKAIPDQKDAIGENAVRAAEALAELDGELEEMADSVPKDKRVLVTAHDAFAYFGRRYGFEVHGIQGISTATEAGAGDIRKLAELIATRKIKAIFTETSVNPATIRALQEAVKARGFQVAIGGSLYSDSLGPTGTPEETLAGTSRKNMTTIVEALR
jgi:manganese/zinc/iron transport system substrate-binding protein